MGSDRKSGKISSDDARNGLQRTRSSHGRTSGPTRKSTRGKWTPEEDEVLRMAVQHFQGKNWKKIAECIKDRTDVQCLHRWQKVLNPELVKGPWSLEEDENIVALVKKHGATKWSTIAQHLPGRIGKQCRERWYNHLDPNINREAWTQDEELTLIRAHQLYGNKWAELSKFLPGRSDNAIKNHWNSSVKKKLDMYKASGLLSQFEGFPLVSHQDQSVASSPSKAPQSSEADSFIKIELEEASEGSQIPGFACASQSTSYATTHPGEEWKVTEESSPLVHHDGYFPEFEEPTFTLPEEQSEMGNKFSEHDLSFCLETLYGKDKQIVPSKLPDMSDSSAGINSSTPFVDMLMGIGVLDLQANSECMMNYSEDNPDGSCPYESCISGIANTLLSNPSTAHINEAYASQSHHMPSSTHDGFNYLKESESSLPIEEWHEKNSSPKPVSPNEFILAPSSDSPCSPSKETAENKRDKQEPGILCYEPPRFPSPDIPFFRCDLVQSSNELQQEFSPFGIRQLMMSSLAPIKLWDSPSRDGSPENILRSAAKTFSSTPSILKKRHRDFASPLSEKRTEGKLERTSRQETLSILSGAFSRLDVMLDDYACKLEPLLPVSRNKRNLEMSCSDKKNVVPCLQIENEGSKSLVNSECDMSPKELKGNELFDRTTDNRFVMDLGYASKTEKDFAGGLMEHDANDLLISPHDQYGVKGGNGISPSPSRSSHQARRKLDSISKHVIFSSSENSCMSVICSPRLSAKKDGANLFIPASFPSSNPEEKDETTCKGAVPECSGVYIDTPLKRIMESPSAWKSPWFLKTFVPGSRVDTELTLEDMGYFWPGDCSYDAIELMKQLGEHTAGTFADAKDVLGDETPDTVMKPKCSSKEQKKTENSDPDSQKDHITSHSPSMFLVEQRTLDFSVWGSPEKKSMKSSNSGVSSSSQCSYLLKECR